MSEPAPVDLLAAQVRAVLGEAGSVKVNDHLARYRRGSKALDALVARVTEAERERDELADSCARVTRAFEKEAARAADARNALERIAALDGSWDEQTKCPDCAWDSGPYLLPCAKHDVEKLAREVLARLDGNSG